MKWPRMLRKRNADERTAEVLKYSKETSEDTARVAKELRDLLRADGVALQIVIASGGGRHKK